MDTAAEKGPREKDKRPPVRRSVSGKRRKGQTDGEAQTDVMLDIKYSILPQQVGFWVRRAQLAVMKSFEIHTKALNLRPVEAAAVLIIGENPDISQIILAAALGTDQSTMVAICSRLEGRGFIERRRLEEDRRYQLLNLTAAGEKMAGSVRKALASHDKNLTKAMTPEQRQQLIALLRMLIPE